ncbi:MAG: aminotransferase class V-fold PLP-dependent enzyme [Haliscomenobacteraceae bacterium CHB4]|nr:aminotransferase class V-fold PLP-dependent enzyme [Haliscomenobacteraceae bacterium CHB4]
MKASDRRSFIRQTAALLGGIALHQNFASAFPIPNPGSAIPNPQSDDDFWRQVRQAFAASPNIINLNNGGVCPAPRATMDALDYYNRMCNEAPSFYMWRILEDDREPLRYNLADLAGVSPEEIAINRNATESLNTIIFGLDLKAGDEVVLSKYDYPNMINAWKQREKRDGIKLVWVDPELPSEDENYLTDAYVSKFSAQTRLVHLTHIINWNGQILPVRRIADYAHSRGIEVLVDAAHSFAVLDYKIPDLGCDYWGTSLHKFLCGPFGSGMMWVKKEKIAGIWPLLSHNEPASDNIRKFESLGTRSFPIEMAIGYSLDLHNFIGSARKQQRLHFLKNYWMEQVRDLPGIRFFTSPKPEWSCAIGNFGFEGKKAIEITTELYNKWKIHTVAIEWEKINGVRVTPNVYTTTDELDKLVMAVKKLLG